MRYHELFENRLPNIQISGIPTKEQEQQIIDLIVQNCKPYFKETKGGIFKRGMDIDESVSIIDVNKNRLPKDSKLEIHNIFNSLIKLYGKTANRSNSVFVTSDESQANNYGKLFYIFPIGNFHYTWLNGVSDWFIYFGGSTIDNDLLFDNNELLAQVREKHADKSEKEILHIFHQLKKSIVQNMKTSNIQIHDLNPKIIEFFKNNIRGDDNTLHEAYDSGEEVMLNCDQYIAIHDDIFTLKFEKKLFKILKISKMDIIMSSATKAFEYAYNVLNAPFPEGENIISKNAKYSYLYACDILKGPFPKGETAIASNPAVALKYTNDVLKSRFIKGEPMIAKNAEDSFEYVSIIKQPFPLGEPAIATNAWYSFYYALNILKGRFPLGERVIAKNAEYSFKYAILIRDRFELGEPSLKKDTEYWEKYINFLKKIGKYNETI